MLGLTMRSYKEVVQQFADAYGLEKSTTCEHFVEASRKKLKELLERSLAGLSLAVMVIDGTIFKGQSLVVAVGIDASGRKLVLGLRQGATENATVVSALLGDLMERGLDFAADRQGWPVPTRRRRLWETSVESEWGGSERTFETSRPHDSG